MAPKRNIRPSAARAALIACIVVMSMLAFLTAAVSAQNCQCHSGRVVQPNAHCFPNWSSDENQYWHLEVDHYSYPITCQRQGNSVNGNSWWNYIQLPSGDHCYINDWYLRTGCETQCYNLPICPHH